MLIIDVGYVNFIIGEIGIYICYLLMISMPSVKPILISLSSIHISSVISKRFNDLYSIISCCSFFKCR